MKTKAGSIRRMTLSILVIAVILSAFAFTLSVYAADPEVVAYTVVDADKTWYGDGSATEFTVQTFGELMYFAELVDSGVTFAGKTVKLGADVTVNAGTASKDGFATEAAQIYSWTTVGVGTAKCFQGTFDGQEHKISGIYLTGASNAAMFECVKSTAIIKNLKLDNIYISATGTNAAVVAGQVWNTPTFDTIAITNAFVKSKTAVGGIIGAVCGAGAKTINKCSFSGAVEAETNAGGLVGSTATGSTLNISECAVVAEVNATDKNAGGVAGLLNCIADFGKISVDGSVTGTNSAEFAYMNSTAAKAVSFTDCFTATEAPLLIDASAQEFNIGVKYGAEETVSFASAPTATVNAAFRKATTPDTSDTAALLCVLTAVSVFAAAVVLTAVIAKRKALLK